MCPTFTTEYLTFEIKSDILGSSTVTYELKVKPRSEEPEDPEE